RHGHYERVGESVRTRRQGLARQRPHDCLRAQPRESCEGRRLGRAGADDRDGRQHRTGDGSAPPFRDSPERPEVQPRLLVARGGGPRGPRQGRQESHRRAMTAGSEPSPRGDADPERRLRPVPPPGPADDEAEAGDLDVTDDAALLELPADDELDREETETLGRRTPIEIYLSEIRQ